MKKLLLIITLSFCLYGCQTTISEQVSVITEKAGTSFNNLQSSFKTYDFVKWDCYDSIDVDVYGYKTYGNHILTVGYIPELKSPIDENITWGKMFIQGTQTDKNTFYFLEGVQHNWTWEENYQITIKSDGEGYYYDFTNVEKGKEIPPTEYYDCTSPKTVSIKI